MRHLDSGINSQLLFVNIILISGFDFSSPDCSFAVPTRVAVDMDIHGYIHRYIHGYIHVWISDFGNIHGYLWILMDIFM